MPRMEDDGRREWRRRGMQPVPVQRSRMRSGRVVAVGRRRAARRWMRSSVSCLYHYISRDPWWDWDWGEEGQRERDKPRNQHPPATQHLQVAERLRAQDVLEGLPAAAALAQRAEGLRRGKGVGAQPAQLGEGGGGVAAGGEQQREEGGVCVGAVEEVRGEAGHGVCVCVCVCLE